MHLPDCRAGVLAPVHEPDCTCSEILLGRMDSLKADIERLKQAVVGQSPGETFRWQTDLSHGVTLLATLKEVAQRGIYNPLSTSPKAAEDAIGVICRTLVEVIEVLEGRHG